MSILCESRGDWCQPPDSWASGLLAAGKGDVTAVCREHAARSNARSDTQWAGSQQWTKARTAKLSRWTEHTHTEREKADFGMPFAIRTGSFPSCWWHPERRFCYLVTAFALCVVHKKSARTIWQILLLPAQLIRTTRMCGLSFILFPGECGGHHESIMGIGRIL